MGGLTPLQLAAPLAGLLVLGVGDAMAAAVGVSLGRRRWPGGNKTVEGSLAAVVSMLLALCALGWLMGWVEGFQERTQLGLGTAWEHGWAQGGQAVWALVAGAGAAEEWLRVAGCTVLVCLLEAFTLQIDNLFLPLAFMVAMQVAAAPQPPM
jgi:dolichol kinase